MGGTQDFAISHSQGVIMEIVLKDDKESCIINLNGRELILERKYIKGSSNTIYFNNEIRVELFLVCDKRGFEVEMHSGYARIVYKGKEEIILVDAIQELY